MWPWCCAGYRGVYVPAEAAGRVTGLGVRCGLPGGPGGPPTGQASPGRSPGGPRQHAADADASDAAEAMEVTETTELAEDNGATGAHRGHWGPQRTPRPPGPTEDSRAGVVPTTRPSFTRPSSCRSPAVRSRPQPVLPVIKGRSAATRLVVIASTPARSRRRAVRGVSTVQAAQA